MLTDFQNEETRNLKVDIDLNKTGFDLKKELKKVNVEQGKYKRKSYAIPAELYRIIYQKTSDPGKWVELIDDNKTLKELDMNHTKHIRVTVYKISYYCQFTQKSPNLVVPGPKNAEK